MICCVGRSFVSLAGDKSPLCLTFRGLHFGLDPVQTRVTYANANGSASFNCTLNASLFADDQVSCTTAGGEPDDQYFFSITVAGQASELGVDTLAPMHCLGLGINESSLSGECTCAAGYSGVVSELAPAHPSRTHTPGTDDTLVCR